ncbi:hypothetical protein NB12_001962 [Salmonella enterica subsp. enterica serovar Pomona]|nr:hypothetical protein [Salmonella enterica subsp. enterica serovar Pomona]
MTTVRTAGKPKVWLTVATGRLNAVTRNHCWRAGGLTVSKRDVSALCFLMAAAVAISGNDGWGWLIFAGIIIL